ncbi:MAG: hypothetical protein KJ736_09580 [Candidatus Omnitrophica bacterium]|nr:hypothetical protein [Candidatus Omnitrophota bacterium]
METRKKEKLEKVSRESIKKLDKVKDSLLTIDFDEAMAPLQQEFIVLIADLQKIYKGMEQKERELIDQEYENYYLNGSKYNEKLQEAINKYIAPETWLNELFKDSFDTKEFESQGIIDPQDKELYKKGYDLLKDYKHFEAFQIFKGFLAKYRNTPAEAYIVLHKADCLAADSVEMMEKLTEEEKEDPVELYASLIGPDLYSPVLDEAFIKWRTKYQESNHGLSNWSEIPNEIYNEKRWKIVESIKGHLKQNADDLWAKYQILRLMDYPNISRGGLMGNTNLNYIGALFMDLRQDQEDLNDGAE